MIIVHPKIGRVVQQLQGRPYYLFLYLDALFERDPHVASSFADTQVHTIIVSKNELMATTSLGSTIC
jgi:hypothetical protein